MATSLAFNEQFYLSQNPDVAAAVSRGQFANAQQHYNLNGRFEGRDPNAFFDTSFYLSQYPDVANSRANPLEHFLNFGAAELRFANGTADAAIDTDNSNFANEFNAEAYLAANPDLANAVGTGRAFENAYEHYVLYGQFENRPGTPAGGPFTNTGFGGNNPGNTFALTSAVGEVLNGTAGNDVFSGVLAGANGTLNVGDQINGGSGVDTFNLTVGTAGALPAGSSFSSIEIININQTTAAITGGINATTFAGSTQIWQIGDTIGAAVGDVSNNQTIGYRDTALAAGDGVNVAAGSTTATVALDNVTTGGTLAFTEDTANGLSVINVNGDVAGAGDLTLTTTATDVDTINLGITSNGEIDVSAFTVDVTSINAANSTGNLTIDASAVTELETFTGGSGNDTLSANHAALTNETFVLNAGAGNDIINFDIDAGTNATASVLTGGAGADTFNISATTGNLTAASIATNAALLENLVTISDFTASADVLDISDLAAVTAGRTAQNVVNSAVTSANATNLLEAVTAVAGATADNGYSVFSFGGNAYVYAESGAADGLDAGDTLIQLTGVTVASLTADNLLA